MSTVLAMKVLCIHLLLRRSNRKYLEAICMSTMYMKRDLLLSVSVSYVFSKEAAVTSSTNTIHGDMYVLIGT